MTGGGCMRVGSRLLLALTATLMFSGCEKARLDQEARRLCKIDGGVKVYETVRLPPDRFDKYGNISLPFKEKATLGDDYFLESSAEYLMQGNPSLLRSHHRIIRRKDGVILGESVRYIRSGGDVPSPLQESSFSCPPISPDRPSLTTSVFKVRRADYDHPE